MNRRVKPYPNVLVDVPTFPTLNLRSMWRSHVRSAARVALAVAWASVLLTVGAVCAQA